MRKLMRAAATVFVVAIGSVLLTGVPANAATVWSNTINCASNTPAHLTSVADDGRIHYHNDGYTSSYHYPNSGYYSSHGGVGSVLLSVDDWNGTAFVSRVAMKCKA
jgi:hypothetical protein